MRSRRDPGLWLVETKHEIGFYQRIEAARINTSFHHQDMKTEELRRENIFLGFQKNKYLFDSFLQIYIVDIITISVFSTEAIKKILSEFRYGARANTEFCIL